MRKELLSFFYFLILTIGFHTQIIAQSLPVGSIVLDDYYRRSQLTGNVDSTISFTIRPIFPNIYFQKQLKVFQDTLRAEPVVKNSKLFHRIVDKNFKIEVLPLSFLTQLNTHHPYGWNDGALIPAKGVQSIMSAGLFMEYGILAVQLRPEFVYAANAEFSTLHPDTYDILVARYYDYYNNIDLPARFGRKAYTRAFWGQSSIRVNYNNLSFGLSSENLWWGPGIRNSLLMSNSAPGFKHLTFNTVKPIETKIGSFEGQIIAGKLENSKFGVLEPEWDYFSSSLFVPKKDDWRYISGLVISYQPKWIPGLFLGMARSSQLYSGDLSKVGDYLPFFSTTKKVAAESSLQKRDNRSSYYARWLWPEERAEIYFEFGRNNNLVTKRNQFLEPARNRAYIFGLRKLLPFNSSLRQNILISIEASQLQETNPKDILDGDSWYINKYVRHGYTNKGEVLGAGIGPGANSQTIDVSWLKGLKKLGLQFERYVHNNDLYIYSYINNHDARRHWTDLSISFNGEWNYKNILFNTRIMGIKSLNYQWYLYQGPNDDINVSGKDAFTMQIQAGFSYRF